MGELWRYYNEDYWEYFQRNVVDKELPKNLDFYNQIKSRSPYEDDITKSLASLAPLMFGNSLLNFDKWMEIKIPALNNLTPREVSKYKFGMNWIREFILRS